MTGVSAWLLIAALLGGLIAIQFAVRRYVTGPGMLYTFVRSNGASPPLSRLFGVGGQRALLSDKKPGVDFQMKIEAQGPRNDLDA